MSRKIKVEFLDLKIKFCATLLDEDEPELCDAFWKRLEAPLKMFCFHTLSTGGRFLAQPRDAKHPQKWGSQGAPIGNKKANLCDLEPGTIIYTGSRLEFAYGAITEPNVSGGSVIAIVNSEDLDDLVKAGQAVWNAQYMTHRLVILEVRREEK